jgi:transcriptional regulator with XRE-family HTH domain
MSEIIENVAEQIREAGVLEDRTERADVVLDTDPSTPEPVLDPDSPEAVNRQYEQLKAAHEADPKFQERQAARALKESDAKLGESIRAAKAKEDADAFIDELTSNFEEIGLDWPDTDNWDAEPTLNARGAQLITARVARGDSLEDIAADIGEEPVAMFAANYMSQVESQRSAQEADATLAYAAAGQEFQRLAGLGQNATVAPQAAEIMQMLVDPDSPVAQAQGGALDLTNMTEEQGRAFTMVAYEIAAAEYNLNGPEAVAEREQTVATQVSPNGTTDTAWFRNEYLPELAQKDPVAFAKIIDQVYEPRELDWRPIIAPLSIPLEEALASNDTETIRHHSNDIMERAARMASESFGMNITPVPQASRKERQAPITFPTKPMTMAEREAAKDKLDRRGYDAKVEAAMKRAGF